MYLALYILNLLDWLTTHFLINVWRCPQIVEGNPLMAPLIHTWWIPLFKVFGMALVICVLYYYRNYSVARKGAKILLVLYLLVVINNSFLCIDHLIRR